MLCIAKNKFSLTFLYNSLEFVFCFIIFLSDDETNEQFNLEVSE